ncbi:OLC1v1004688C1 [Oldenlandia corymbosa var. corymbosa]|uniref:OLC1v1004688C1 n=1 Tax=Oldenlandia corymbosa var. corymbosa TaxID=529605 RepID=A0AAV1DFK7_OLDCO|nr:OLC1v1004688C1 [Oldenlandia corymbosa var. corymbosa]
MECRRLTLPGLRWTISQFACRPIYESRPFVLSARKSLTADCGRLRKKGIGGEKLEKCWRRQKFKGRRKLDKLCRNSEVVDFMPVMAAVLLNYVQKEPQSGAVIYVLCVQNLSKQSALDAELLIGAVKPDAVVAQVGPSISGDDFSMDAVASEESVVSTNNYSLKRIFRWVDESPVPTSAFEVIKRCFVHKISKEKYEDVAGNLVLKEIFGIGFNGHFLSAKKAAKEVGASFLLLDSPYVKWSEDGMTALEIKQEGKEENSVNKFHALFMRPGTLVPQRAPSVISAFPWRFPALNDVQIQMVKALPLQLTGSDFAQKLGSASDQPRHDYEAPQFSQFIYPLLVDLHDIFISLKPGMGRALAHAQKILCDVNKGEVVDSKLLSEVYVFRRAVEDLRIALNNAGRLPISELGNSLSSGCEFSQLPVWDKSHALVAQAVRSQTSRFKKIVAVVDSYGLEGLRKHWNTSVPLEVKDMVEQLVTDGENGEKVQNQGGGKLPLSAKPVVAFGAGATAVLGASSLSKVVHLSTLAKVASFKMPASLKLLITQSHKIVGLTFSNAVPSTAMGPGMINGVQVSVLKTALSAEKIRAVAHGMIASAEKTSLSAMRMAFYEIMRRRDQPTRFLPWATFGCSIATCSGLLMYGDGIECAVESLPAARSIACLGRGIQNLHQASQTVRQDDNSRLQKSIKSLWHKFRQWKIQ